MPRRPRGTPPQNRNGGGRDRPRRPEAAEPAAPPAGLAAKLAELIAAAFPGVLVTGDEPEEVPRDLARLCGERDWNLATWAADGGEDGPADPLAAVKALPQSGDGGTPGVLAMVHAHRLFNSAELLAAIRTTLVAGKTRRTHLVPVHATGELPPELRRDFVTVAHPLPSREDLDAFARGVATEPGELPEQIAPVLDAAAGLTRSEAENAFALSLVRHGRLDPDPLWEMKAKQLAAGGP